MSVHAEKTHQKNGSPGSDSVTQKQTADSVSVKVEDNRSEPGIQRKLQTLADNSPQVRQLKALQDIADNRPQAKQHAPLQKKENKTGLPDTLKTGMENLSGVNLDGVRVHRNSDKPAQLNAHAYAQGTDIHLAPGQEKHLPHEAWHVVQQKQGRVSPTIQTKSGVPVNDDAALEKEADIMGDKALQMAAIAPHSSAQTAGNSATNVSSVAQLSGDDWALESNKKARRDLDLTEAGSAFKFVEDHGDSEAFGTTLHHHVSRATMTDIVTAYKASLRAHSKMKRGTDKDELGEALSLFQKTIFTIASEAELDSDNIETLLHNLPLNLHYGPSIVKGDPGSGFDPSTRERPDSGGQRELEPTSAALAAFLGAYRAGVDAQVADGGGDLPGETWTSMAAHMQTANTKYKEAGHSKDNPIAFNPEQWIGTEGSDTYAKKGSNAWPGFARAQERFAERTAPLGAGGAGISANHDFTINDSSGTAVTFRIGYTTASLHHFCDRHTYRHFDPAQIKLQNTFFPAGTNQAAVVGHAARAFAMIEAELKRLVEGDREDYEITGGMIEVLGSEGHTFRSGDLEICVIDREDFWAAAVDGAIEMVMMVPVGGAYESYTAAQLRRLELA